MTRTSYSCFESDSIHIGFFSKRGNIMTDYSRAFRIIRSVYDLEQKELAKILGVNPSYISFIESKKKQPSEKILSLISEKLGVPSNLLLLLADNTNNKIDSTTKKELGEFLLKVLRDVNK